MKQVLLLTLSLLGFSALAAAADVDCAKQISCGTYEGSGRWYTYDNQPLDKDAYSEKIVIAPIDASSVNVKVYIYTGQIGDPWCDAVLKFDGDGGRFTMTQDGEAFGNGFCENNVCTFSFRPFPEPAKDGKPAFVNSFVDILRFEGDKLKRFNMVANDAVDANLLFQRSDLTRK
jgi:hypothetical protein